MPAAAKLFLAPTSNRGFDRSTRFASVRFLGLAQAGLSTERTITRSHRYA